MSSNSFIGTVISELLARQSCGKCGGPLDTPDGRFVSINLIPNTALCYDCNADELDRLSQEQWEEGRRELENDLKECRD